ncbi:MAG: type II toxin-antitoxin system prevent-host-death family antitoxin [Myxococcota bacterium]
MNVGTKELKNRLSHYLRLVRRGELIRVTDRGKVVAELRSVEAGPESDEQQMLRSLEDGGVVTVGGGRHEDFTPVRVRTRVSASHFVETDVTYQVVPLRNSLAARRAK